MGCRLPSSQRIAHVARFEISVALVRLEAERLSGRARAAERQLSALQASARELEVAQGRNTTELEQLSTQQQLLRAFANQAYAQQGETQHSLRALEARVDGVESALRALAGTISRRQE